MKTVNTFKEVSQTPGSIWKPEKKVQVSVNHVNSFGEEELVCTTVEKVYWMDDEVIVYDGFPYEGYYVNFTDEAIEILNT